MFIRTLNKDQYDRFCHDLQTKCQALPLDPSYTVSLTINGVEYLIKCQPEDRQAVAVLHALRVRREEDGPGFELITETPLLRSFLEILLAQGVA